LQLFSARHGLSEYIDNVWSWTSLQYTPAIISETDSERSTFSSLRSALALRRTWPSSS